MPLDPEVQAFLQRAATAGARPPEELPLEEARRGPDSTAAALFGPMDELAAIEDATIPGPGGPIPVRLYRPSMRRDLPILIYFHSGGWVVGSLETHEGLCRALAKKGDCLVVSVAYRLAPEHKFPAAVEDAWAAVQWLARHADDVGGDPARLAVGGDSSGGNLAAVVALRARDHGLELALQLLVYPVVDCNFETLSYRENAEGYNLNRSTMRWYWRQYLASESDAANPDASPLRAVDVSGVAPALVIVCEYDPLRDEGLAYARRLESAGVPVSTRCYEGQIHGFLRMPAVIGRAREAIGESAGALRAAFSKVIGGADSTGGKTV
ncbi:alpha/beta hydrolase [bacterium]|nr:MAG: alpha/beta hydrolase [bacterium]